MDVESVLGWWTGLHWLAPDMPFATLVRTAIVVHICDAVVCGILAKGARRRWSGWALAGLVAGIWALIALLVLPSRREKT